MISTRTELFLQFIQRNMSTIQAGALTDNCGHHHRFAASIQPVMMNKPLEPQHFGWGITPRDRKTALVDIKEDSEGLLQDQHPPFLGEVFVSRSPLWTVNC